MPFSLREFCLPQDYAAVLDLWHNSGPGVQVCRSDDIAEIEKKLTHDPDLFLVAEADGQIIGTVLGGFDGRRGLIYHLAVAAEYRETGLGGALMAEIETRLRQKGCLKAYLLVTNSNEEVLPFYEKRGWEEMHLHLLGKKLAD